MSTLTQDMKDMIATQQCFVATVNADGTPNVGPKRSTRVHDDATLIFNEGTAGATYENMKRGSRVAVAVVNRETLDGYRFVCDAELLTEGHAIYAQAKALALQRGMPAPRAAALLHIREIHSLKPGPTAGKKIG